MVLCLSPQHQETVYENSIETFKKDLNLTNSYSNDMAHDISTNQTFNQFRFTFF
jgi:hypothetical protein